MRALRAAACAAAGAAVVVAAAAASPSAHAGWWDQAAVAHETKPDAVLGQPSLWIDVPVTCVVRFAGKADLPTDAADFPAAEWSAFAARADGAEPCARFLVRRGSAEAARIDGFRAGEEFRLRAVARVPSRTALAAKPAGSATPVLEVVWVSGSDDPLAPEEAAAVARADELLVKDNPAAAETLYRSVIGSRTFAPEFRAELLRRLARACREQRKFADAVAALREALALDPRPGTRSEIARLEAAGDRVAADAVASAVTGDAAAIPVPVAGLRLAPPRNETTAAAGASKPEPPTAGTPKTAPKTEGSESGATGTPPAAPQAPAAAPKDMAARKPAAPAAAQPGRRQDLPPGAVPEEPPPPPPAQRLAPPK